MGEYLTLSIVKFKDWNIRLRWNSWVFTFLCSPSPSLRCLWRQTRRRRTRPRRTMESAPRPRTRGSMSSFVACYEICLNKALFGAKSSGLHLPQSRWKLQIVEKVKEHLLISSNSDFNSGNSINIEREGGEGKGREQKMNLMSEPGSNLDVRTTWMIKEGERWKGEDVDCRMEMYRVSLEIWERGHRLCHHSKKNRIFLFLHHPCCDQVDHLALPGRQCPPHWGKA